MVCILKFELHQIAGWFIAADVPDARRQAEIIGERYLAEILYRVEFAPEPGSYVLEEGLPPHRINLREAPQMTNGYLMLVT